MNSNHIFPITDLPRGLGLNFFSLVFFKFAQFDKIFFAKFHYAMMPKD